MKHETFWHIFSGYFMGAKKKITIGKFSGLNRVKSDGC